MLHAYVYTQMSVIHINVLKVTENIAFPTYMFGIERSKKVRSILIWNRALWIRTRFIPAAGVYILDI